MHWKMRMDSYVYLVMNIVGIGTVWEIGNYGEVIRLDEISRMIFQSDGVFTYAMNIIMFMPLGFLLPPLWDKYWSVSKTSTAGIVFSLLSF